MLLARVKGQMVCTIKQEGFSGEKLLIVEPLDPLTGKADGTEIIACDRADAGVGDIVLLLQEGGSARQVMGKPNLGIEALVVGFIDRVNV